MVDKAIICIVAGVAHSCFYLVCITVFEDCSLHLVLVDITLWIINEENFL